jgi:hypothetical protein
VLFAFVPFGVNTYKDAEMRTVLTPLADLAAMSGCTILLLRHPPKSGGNDAVNWGGGSVAVAGIARAAMLVARDPDDESGDTRVLAWSKSNLSREPSSLNYRLTEDVSRTVRIEWGAASAHRAVDLIAAPVSPEEREETNACRAWLRGFLALNGGVHLAGAVHDAAASQGYSKSALGRASKGLGVIKRKDGMRGRWQWTLPESIHRLDISTEDPGDPVAPEGPASQDSETFGEQTEIPLNSPKIPGISETGPSGSTGSTVNDLHEGGSDG